MKRAVPSNMLTRTDILGLWVIHSILSMSLPANHFCSILINIIQIIFFPVLCKQFQLIFPNCLSALSLTCVLKITLQRKPEHKARSSRLGWILSIIAVITLVFRYNIFFFFNGNDVNRDLWEVLDNYRKSARRKSYWRGLFI
jgi:hypothetical protein